MDPHAIINSVSLLVNDNENLLKQVRFLQEKVNKQAAAYTNLENIYCREVNKLNVEETRVHNVNGQDVLDEEDERSRLYSEKLNADKTDRQVKSICGLSENSIFFSAIDAQRAQSLDMAGKIPDGWSLSIWNEMKLPIMGKYVKDEQIPNTGYILDTENNLKFTSFNEFASHICPSKQNGRGHVLIRIGEGDWHTINYYLH
jgi:hypothetical protein